MGVESIELSVFVFSTFVIFPFVEIGKFVSVSHLIINFLETGGRYWVIMKVAQDTKCSINWH